MCIQKNQKKIFVLSIFLISLIFAACNKQGDPPAANPQGAVDEISKAGNSGSANTARRLSSGEAYVFERIPVQHRISPTDGTLPQLPFRTGAHREHLNDPLAFSNLPDGGIPNGPTAVVGSDHCLFYPLETISSEAELAKLPKGEAIPFAAIIPLGDKLENSNGDKANMFEFQGNLNFFYKTTWNGKRGIVFGADLYGIGASNEDNRLSALLYKDSGYFGSFYPVNGYEKISPNILAELETNGLAIQNVKPSEYVLSLEGKPDDMISLYVTLAARNRAPMFVTTDLAAHANHLVFDRMLQYVEENHFFPQMIALTDQYIKAIEQQKTRIPENVYTTSLLYFQTAQALLALAPQRVKGTDYYSTTEYRDVNAEEVLRNYPPKVVAEIEKMNHAADMGASSIFAFGADSALALKEDYSQYKVRGHYTKNGVLGAYFRALMWYGRINFTLGNEDGNTGDFALQLAPVALFIADLTENSPELKKLWASLFDPMTEIIGASDDISFNELIPLWNKIKGADFAQWSKDPKKIEAFITQGHKELRSPAISGSSLFLGIYAGGPAMADRLPPKGWRLFGQRYTLDNEIHHWVSPPRLMYRDMVRGLDILKVFGSRTADSLLRESDYLNPRTPRLEAALNSLQRNLAGVKDDYWLSTYYTNILYQIRTQALFENGTGFYFTEKPGWNLKALNAAHGTWAELRHDTILYAKQSFAENLGGGDWEPTFRTKPLPQPIHYLEPNVPFWVISAIGIERMYAILEKYDYLDGRTAQVLAGMHELFVKAAEISQLEADNKPVSENDLQWIGKIAARLATLVTTHAEGNISDDADALRMALVADVFTSAETGLVLETAVGIPYRLYVPLNDKQGGKRIAMGYGFSYYEFSQPMSNRLNNEQWKATVYGNTDMKQYLPFWMEGKTQPAK